MADRGTSPVSQGVSCGACSSITPPGRREARGSGGDRVTLDEDAFPSPDPAFDPLALDDLLTRLAAIDQHAAEIAELRIFGGLTVRETAEQLAISARTVSTDWTMARAWARSASTAARARVP